MPVEHIELALDLHGVAVDRVFPLLRRIGVEMPEPATEIGGGAHLPEEPREHLGPGLEALNDGIDRLRVYSVFRHAVMRSSPA